MPNQKVTAEQFVREYLRGGTHKEIAARLGLTVGAVGTRAAHMRAKGVALPSSARVDVAGLNAVIETWRRK